MTTHLDGNVLAGTLGELFAVDITSAMGQCASCGTSEAMGEALVYPTRRVWWPAAAPARR